MLETESVPFVPMEKIEFPAYEITVKDSEEIKLDITITPSNATKQTMIWTSDHPDVLMVDKNGEITPHRNGLATVIVRTEDGFIYSIVYCYR